ncbi:hypothetical protein HRbin20_01735 [bacterium HR20]|nr:hypothetical protein HRbin20_01735 [bacterium HR20]
MFFHHPPHEVGDVDLVHTVAEAALEAVTIQERQKELEVLLFAVVWCRGQQQKVSAYPRKKLTELVTLGVLDLASVERCGHLVGFVHDHKIPPAIGSGQFRLDGLVAGGLVESHDHEIILEEPIAAAGSVELIGCHDLEGQVKTLGEFVLPLLDEVARTNDHAASHIPTDQELLDEQPCHDCLARPRVICEQKP